MGKVIGIDLGTTNSVAAIADGFVARALENRENKSQTRSMVGMRIRKGKEPEVLVGDVALNYWPLAPKDTIISIKRLMGRGVADKDVQEVRKHYQYQVVEPSDGTKDSVRVVMAGKQYSPVEVSAMILRKIKEDAEFRLGEEVTAAVITVPAYFDQAQKAATRLAGQKAGFRVIKILDEPTAAAIAFGMDSAQSGTPVMRNICVYDLGGGTFDISVLMWSGNIFSPLDLEGDMWLGGDNFDQQLIGHVLKHIENEYSLNPRSNDRFMAELQRAAKEAKERLTASKTTEIIVSGLLKSGDGDLIDVQLEVTREQFEAMAQPLVDRSIELVELALVNAKLLDATTIKELPSEVTANLPPDFRLPLEVLAKMFAEKTLPSKVIARLAAERIDYVLMAGNASCMPIVQNAVEKLFGAKKIKRDIHPKNCVAMGAAKLAAVLGPRVVCQAPHPSNPKQECNNVNDLDDKVCRKCGAPLQFNDLKFASHEVLAIDIAPFSYGVQLAGDHYRVFVKKGDPVPTTKPETQSFPTQISNQRIICIPVYGGENMTRASAPPNKKQGDVYAVLPPELPKGKIVRVKVWLDRDGAFMISAHLEDGTDLHPLILKGEKDAKAMEALEQMESAWEVKGLQLTEKDLQSIKPKREQAFDSFKREHFDDAMQQAETVRQEIESSGEKDRLLAQAEQLAGVTQFILSHYGWALAAEFSYKLNEMLQHIRTAIAKNDKKAIPAKLKSLEGELNHLPELVMALFGLRMDIGVIKLKDSAAAVAFIQRLDAIEAECEKAASDEKPMPIGRLNQLIRDVQHWLALHTSDDGDQNCSGCGRAWQPGEQKCPQCGCHKGLLGLGRCSCGHSWQLGEQKCPKCGLHRGMLGADAGTLKSSGIISG